MDRNQGVATNLFHSHLKFTLSSNESQVWMTALSHLVDVNEAVTVSQEQLLNVCCYKNER